MNCLWHTISLSQVFLTNCRELTSVVLNSTKYLALIFSEALSVSEHLIHRIIKSSVPDSSTISKCYVLLTFPWGAEI